MERVGCVLSFFFSYGGFEFRIKNYHNRYKFLGTLPLVNILKVKIYLEIFLNFLKIEHLSDSQVFELVYLFCL